MIGLAAVAALGGSGGPGHHRMPSCYLSAIQTVDALRWAEYSGRRALVRVAGMPLGVARMRWGRLNGDPTNFTGFLATG
jgi:hypothetical protein